MAHEPLDELEAKLDPWGRAVFKMLREENVHQRRQLEANAQQIAALTAQLGLVTEQLANQTELLEDFRRRLFGNRSEKLPTVKEELRRRIDPAELTVDGTPMPEDPEARAKEKRRKSRKAGEARRKSKRGLRKGLPVILEEKSVTAEQLPEGYTLEDFRKLGDGKIVGLVEHVREHLVIQRFVLETLISKDGEQIITAEGPPTVVDGGHYGPGLYAHVVVSRCDDIMPLYGNEKALERAGFPIARSTLCTIFHRAAEQLRLIYDEIRRVVRAGRYVHADETTQRVLDKEHCLKGWMWVMLSQQAIAYHYSDHRNSDTARELLGDTTGNLTIDGYSAYTCLGEKDARRERSGCWGHYLELVVIWHQESLAHAARVFSGSYEVAAPDNSTKEVVQPACPSDPCRMQSTGSRSRRFGRGASGRRGRLASTSIGHAGSIATARRRESTLSRV